MAAISSYVHVHKRQMNRDNMGMWNIRSENSPQWLLLKLCYGVERFGMYFVMLLIVVKTNVLLFRTVCIASGAYNAFNECAIQFATCYFLLIHTINRSRWSIGERHISSTFIQLFNSKLDEFVVDNELNIKIWPQMKLMILPKNQNLWLRIVFSSSWFDIY